MAATRTFIPTGGVTTPRGFRASGVKAGIKKNGNLEEYQGYGNKGLAVMEDHLKNHQWLALDRPTIADIAIFPWIATAEEGGFTIAAWPNVRAWAERMLAQRGAAHPYTILPKEDRDATR